MLFDAVARGMAKRRTEDNAWLQALEPVREEMKGIPAYKDSYAELSGPRSSS